MDNVGDALRKEFETLFVSFRCPKCLVIKMLLNEH